MIKRTEKIELRVTPGLKAAVKQAAAKRGLTASAFIVRTLEARLRREPDTDPPARMAPS